MPSDFPATLKMDKIRRQNPTPEAAVRAGILCLEEACRRCTLAIEEFLSRQRLVESDGLRVCASRACKIIAHSR
jgi:hypothetical protein